jgi:hypothetical protein
MTPEERAVVDKLDADQKAADAAADAAWAARDPACWSWPNMPDMATWQPAMPPIGGGNDCLSQLAFDALQQAYEIPEERERTASTVMRQASEPPRRRQA